MALTYELKRRRKFSQFFFSTPFGVQVDAGEKKNKRSEKREEKAASFFLSFFLPSFRSFVSFRVCEIRRGLDSIFRSGFSRNERANGLGGWKVVVVLCGVSSPAPTATALHLILIKEVEEPGQRESTLKFAAV